MALTVDTIMPENHYAILHGPISIEEGVTITVGQDSKLTIH